jgi:hypothetical protein
VCIYIAIRKQSIVHEIVFGVIASPASQNKEPTNKQKKKTVEMKNENSLRLAGSK